MTQHTPGPWVRDDSYTTGAINTSDYGVERGVGHHVALVSVFGVPSGEWEANANLIAAAPELLAACEFGGKCVTGPRMLETAAEILAAVPAATYLASQLKRKAEMERAAIAKALGKG